MTNFSCGSCANNEIFSKSSYIGTKRIGNCKRGAYSRRRGFDDTCINWVSYEIHSYLCLYLACYIRKYIFFTLQRNLFLFFKKACVLYKYIYIKIVFGSFFVFFFVVIAVNSWTRKNTRTRNVIIFSLSRQRMETFCAFEKRGYLYIYFGIVFTMGKFLLFLLM